MRIVSACVRYGGLVHEAKNHSDAMRKVWELMGYPVKIRQEDQGFVTDTGRFVDRRQAGAIAFRAGQTAVRRELLLSEHLTMEGDVNA